MKKTLLMLVLFALPAMAQSISGNITTSSSDCSIGAACISLPLQANAAAAGIQVTGTYTGTLQFELTLDAKGCQAASTAFVNVSGSPLPSGTAASSTTSTGTWRVNSAGGTCLRVRASAFASGTAAVTLNYGTGSASAGAGGGSPVSFDSLVGGTNTSAAMVVGTGASLATSGSGTIAATSVPFSGVAAGTNAGALVIGTGGSLGTSGSGTIAATTVTTNANLTGPITSTGNATAIASQTGTGTTFVTNAGNPALTGTLSVGTNATSSGTINASGDIAQTPDSGHFGQIEIMGATSTSKRLSLGYDTTHNAGFISALTNGVSNDPLILSPTGGNVTIGTTTAGSAGLNVTGTIVGTSTITGTTVSGTTSLTSPLVTGTTTNVASVAQAGVDANTTGVAATMTLRGENVVAGGSNNLAGGDVIIQGGISTGTATPAHVKLQSTALGLAAAATQQGVVTQFTTHKKAGSTTSATPTTLFNIASATNTGWGMEILVHVDLISSTPNVCSTTERFSLSGTNNNGTFGTVNIVAGTISTLCSAGTLTLAVTATAANPSVISVTPTWGTITSITSATITVQINNVSQQEITLL